MTKELSELMEERARKRAKWVYSPAYPDKGFDYCVETYKQGAQFMLSLEVLSKVPEVAALIEACRLYADKSNWKEDDYGDSLLYAHLNDDEEKIDHNWFGGVKARLALKPFQESGG